MNFKEIINKNLCPLCLNNMIPDYIVSNYNFLCEKCSICSIVKTYKSYYNFDLYIYDKYDLGLELNIIFYKKNELVEFFVQNRFEILINNVGQNMDSSIDPIEYWKALLILI